MRTTLTLDEDLAEALSRTARLTGRSFKAVVNEAIRRGLSCGDQPTQKQRPPFRVEPQACGLMPGIDPLRLNQLVDQLELEEAAGHHSGAGGAA
ncbi:MAG: CopG family transcriptional regulator [Cyanobacteriota bacterium]|nr:CopG family transcriptional regulator [Cyanobacteriota bacterium]